MDKSVLMCCHIECDKQAEYVISWGDKPDDYTHSCLEHLGEMLTDNKWHTLESIE